MRNVGNGARIGGDILPHRTIAAGGGLLEHPVLIAQRERQTIDLWLRSIGQRRFGPKPQVFTNPRIELCHILCVKGIGQRQHRHRMAHLAKAVGYRCTDLLRGAIASF